MTDRMALFPLGTVLFPGVPLPLHVFEPRYRELMHDLTSRPRPWTFGVVAIREGHEVGAESVKSLYDVGCTAVIQQIEQLPDGRFAALLVGERRFRLLGIDESRSYLQADIDVIDDQDSRDTVDDAVAVVRERFMDYCVRLGTTTIAAALPGDATELSYVVAATLLVPLADRQMLLELGTAAERLRVEADLLSRELVLMRTGTMPVAQPRLPPHSQN